MFFLFFWGLGCPHHGAEKGADRNEPLGPSTSRYPEPPVQRLLSDNQGESPPRATCTVAPIRQSRWVTTQSHLYSGSYQTIKVSHHPEPPVQQLLSDNQGESPHRTTYTVAPIRQSRWVTTHLFNGSYQTIKVSHHPEPPVQWLLLENQGESSPRTTSKVAPIRKSRWVTTQNYLWSGSYQTIKVPLLLHSISWSQGIEYLKPR